MKDLYDILREFRKRPGARFALATLVRAEGSSYRRSGARMLICEDGRTVGSLSGGCLEEEVAQTALDVMRTGVPALISFDTRKRYGCHGKIDIFIERVSETFLTNLAGHLGARRSCCTLTTFAGETRELGSCILEPVPPVGEADSFPYSNNALAQIIHPPIQLFICGDGPDSAPLRSFAALLGWISIDVSDANSWEVQADNWTAAIVKSHNYGRDFAALQKLLPLNLRYVGLIGPRRRRDQLLHSLLDIGVPINAGFFSPAGVDLHAETPEEIALAVISEIQRVFAGGTGESLRERKVSIHAGKESDKGLAAAHPPAHLDPLPLAEKEKNLS